MLFEVEEDEKNTLPQYKWCKQPLCVSLNHLVEKNRKDAKNEKRRILNQLYYINHKIPDTK